MAFFPRKTPSIGASVKLAACINNPYGTFEQGTFMTIISQDKDGYRLEDEFKNTVSGVDANKFIVL